MVVTILAVLIFAVCASGQRLDPAQYNDTPLDLCLSERNQNRFVSMPQEGCLRFVFCTEKGTAFGPLVCPVGTLFDFETQRCGHISEVQCSDGTPKCESRAVRGECEKFFTCNALLEEVPYICNEGTVYSKRHGVCMRFKRLDEDEQRFCGSK